MKPTRSPNDAMSALTPEFAEAYDKAQRAIYDAVLGFEATTKRVVDQIELARIDLTTLSSVGRELIRSAQLHFLPKDSELG